MENDIDKLLYLLDSEIEKKCLQIKKEKNENILRQIFILGCIVAIVIPVLLVAFSITILNSIIPILIFISAVTLISAPLLLASNNIGGIRE